MNHTPRNPSGSRFSARSADTHPRYRSHPGTLPALHGTRAQLLILVVAVWLAGIFVFFRVVTAESTLVLSHWANVYMMDPTLLPAFAKQFNAAGHRTSAGTRIEVQPVLVNSGVITEELISRATTGHSSGSCNQASGGCPGALPDPTLVTPAADHWFSQANYGAGRPVIDPARTQPLGISYVGIVMLREMARCLGWPNNEIGIADIVALREDPRGWASCPTARAEWGQRPLLGFTDPDSSSTARSMLYALYALGAGKDAELLTESDISNPAVVTYVRDFQRAVDHYTPDTPVLASKIYLGPRYGHFFFLAENNFVNLYRGRLPITIGGETAPKPLTQDMVMVYPKEGSTVHRHSAGVVEARWVTPERKAAAEQWIAFLREEPQQRAIVEQGFRPASNIPYAEVINPRFGVDPNKPSAVINPDRIDPVAAQAILRSWGAVKKPGVATFLVDTSGSMAGDKLAQAKKGLTRALDSIDKNNFVGLLTFSNGINDRVPVGPIKENRYTIANAVEAMRASGGTALFDAIREAIKMTDDAVADEDSIRGVVVLTDGKANQGAALDAIIRMTSREERAVRTCSGHENSPGCQDDSGRLVKLSDLIGIELAVETRHPIHIFFVGIGDADLEIGRVLAEATHSTFRGTTDKNLANVLETFGKYF